MTPVTADERKKERDAAYEAERRRMREKSREWVRLNLHKYVKTKPEDQSL